MIQSMKSKNSGHSASIEMELQVDGMKFAIASIGGERMILRDARTSPAGTGTVRVMVDDHVSTYRVELPTGIDPSRRDQPYRVVQAANAVA